MIGALLGLVRGAVGRVTGVTGLPMYALAIALAASLTWALWLRGEIAVLKAEQAAHLIQDAQAEAKAEAKARQQEHAVAERMAQIDQQLSEERSRADQTIASLRADLDAGRVRLRGRFTCPRLPGASTATGQRDAAAGLRPDDAGFLVRLADECDARIRAAQGVIRADRGR